MNKLPKMHGYEWIFSGFLLVTAARLWAAGAWALGGAFASMAGVIWLAALAATRWPSAMRWRMVWLPVLVNLVYWKLGVVMQILHPAKYDDWLLGIDRAVLGETPALRWQMWSHPIVTEILSGCYLMFFPAVLVAFGAAICRPNKYGVQLANGLIGIYGLGFLGYTLIPAMGPHLALAHAFHEPLTGGLLTKTNASLVTQGSNQVDVFPSLHVAITVFLLGWLWRHHRRAFPFLLFPAVGLGGATIYLRYHYAVDVAAGILLAALGMRMARNPDTSHE